MSVLPGPATKHVPTSGAIEWGGPNEHSSCPCKHPCSTSVSRGVLEGGCHSVWILRGERSSASDDVEAEECSVPEDQMLWQSPSAAHTQFVTASNELSSCPCKHPCSTSVSRGVLEGGCHSVWILRRLVLLSS